MRSVNTVRNTFLEFSLSIFFTLPRFPLPRFQRPPPLNFLQGGAGSKSAKFYFLSLSPLTLSDFETKQLIGNLKLPPGVLMIALYFNSEDSLIGNFYQRIKK